MSVQDSIGKRGELIAISRLLRAAASRTRRYVSACVSCVPCEKLRRNRSTPAATRSRMPASLAVAGPTVATILVRLTMTSLQWRRALVMTINAWLESSAQDAERRELPALRPLLEMLARSMSALRTADWNRDAAGETLVLRPPDVR